MMPVSQYDKRTHIHICEKNHIECELRCAVLCADIILVRFLWTVDEIERLMQGDCKDIHWNSYTQATAIAE